MSYAMHMYQNTNNSMSNNDDHALDRGKIISCNPIYLNNTDNNPSFIHGKLKYYSNDNNTFETINYYSKKINIKENDLVSFDLGVYDNDNPSVYANNIRAWQYQANPIIDNNNILKKQSNPVRLICISDTHNNHDQLTTELCNLYQSSSDILIHCGDMTDNGSKKDLKKVNKWFGKLPFKKEHIIITAGNMDGIGLDNNRYNNNNNGSWYGNNNNTNLGAEIFTNAIYLEHESYYLAEFNLRFFASPYSLRFVGGFQINNNREAELKWKQVPDNIDILITHGPPKDILDSTSSGKHTGDNVLLKHITNRIKPKVMLFGHMHSSYGYKKYKNIHFYNCAQNNSLGRYHSYNNNYSSYSYSNSNTKNNNMNNMKNEIPHVINLQKLS